VNGQSLSLTVGAKPGNLAVIRQALAGYAEAIGFGPDSVADLKTIVTEACMNAVVHAYSDDAPGPIEVGARPRGDGIEVTVRDWGSGFKPRPADPDDPGLRLGLPLIATLSDGFEIRGGPDGTEVRMVMELAPEGQPAPEEERADPEATMGTVMSIAAGTMVRPVLARVISALAARADFSIDRLSDTVLIGDAVSAHDATDFRNGTVGIEIVDDDGRLDVRVGPLVPGGSERIIKGLELPGGTSLRKLASEITVEQSSAGSGAPSEYLLVAIDQ
jgi:serine/threonine-protein kinase RsbW